MRVRDIWVVHCRRLNNQIKFTLAITIPRTITGRRAIRAIIAMVDCLG